ncbi:MULTISPECIES: sensor histidine kinase [unclassified Streptomyces]|uniref:sensor histidine kinase n=1 Tax=unclassified Streptomyces TaxID=2593676 RepID=UPI000DB97827|nr:MULTISPECIES: sensor histidine kinase [unclassified Streptomyces]MYT70683.1 sensor histidine kinase [Streptomyces sp. SID8367]RAJ90388.1 signal transduction histidine kinase [Streptomyces sp. PsTaAH-137]
MGARVRSAVGAGVRGLVLAAVGLAGSITLFVLSLVSVVLVPVGIGAVTTPWVLTLVRHWANWRRAVAAEWCGVRIPAAYRPFPDDLRGGVVGQVERCRLLLGDPATWRDLRWLLVDMTAGFVTALLPAALVLYPVEGYALAAGLWRVFNDGSRVGWWYGFVPISGEGSSLLAALLATALLATGLRTAPALLRVHFLLTRSVLAPADGELAARVRVLTETRRDAVDTSAAELRRIERDLHDGAQARLVAMGMDLGTVEALIEKDPAKAKELLAQARQSSADALAELRDLVRGIHPPVLAERGLGDAVRALALRLPVATEVEVEQAGRAEAPVESAAYFAISEALTNAVKHAGADRIWVDISHADGHLRVAVTDNGKGGAVIREGGGLGGVERRLATFDGVLAVSSPAGGPTMVTMEIPCVLS